MKEKDREREREKRELRNEMRENNTVEPSSAEGGKDGGN